MSSVAFPPISLYVSRGFDHIRHGKVEKKHMAQGMDDERFDFEYEDKGRGVENKVLLKLDVDKLDHDAAAGEI